MIEITLKQPEDFLKVKETLTRMGIANNKDKILFNIVTGKQIGRAHV